MISEKIAVFGIDDSYFGDIIIDFLSKNFYQIGIFGKLNRIEKLKQFTVIGQLIPEKLTSNNLKQIDCYDKILINLDSQSLLDFLKNNNLIEYLRKAKKEIFVVSRVECLNSKFVSKKFNQINSFDKLLNKFPLTHFLRIPFIYHSPYNILLKMLNLSSILQHFCYIVKNSKISLVSSDDFMQSLSILINGKGEDIAGEVYETDQFYQDIYNCLGFDSYKKLWINKVVFKILLIFDFRSNNIKLSNDDIGMIVDNSEVCNIRISINKIREIKKRSVRERWLKDIYSFHHSRKFFDNDYRKFNDYYPFLNQK
jgi:hypothetical protein